MRKRYPPKDAAIARYLGVEVTKINEAIRSEVKAYTRRDVLDLKITDLSGTVVIASTRYYIQYTGAKI